EPGREFVVEGVHRAIDVRVGAPAEVLGTVENLLGAHLEDHVGMGAHPRPARRNVAQQGVEHGARPAGIERIDPDEHAVEAEELVAHLVREGLVEHGGRGVDAGPAQLLEDVVIAIVVRRRRAARLAVAAPENRYLGGLIAVHAQSPRHASIAQCLDGGRLTGSLRFPGTSKTLRSDGGEIKAGCFGTKALARRRRCPSGHVDRLTATVSGFDLSARLWVTTARAAVVLSFFARWGISAGISPTSPALMTLLACPSTSSVNSPSSPNKSYS